MLTTNIRKAPMNTFKSILLSSVLITTTFGADTASRPTDLDADAPTRKTHRAESSAGANKAVPARDRREDL